MKSSHILIIGAGPAGLMAAQTLAESGYKVSIFEHNKAAARKFLVAGHGGFNLTHNEPIDLFVQRYNTTKLTPALRYFDNIKTREWLTNLGIETYVGSSGKIFPTKNYKPIHVLNNWLNKLSTLDVKIHYEHKLIDFDNNTIKIEHNGNTETIHFTKLILALGGGSWKKTGSNAEWVDLFHRKNIKTEALASANSGYNTSLDFSVLEGQNLKNIELKFNTIQKKGEITFTSYGIEGSPLYYLNRFTRSHSFPYDILLDLKPNLSEEQIIKALETNRKTTVILKEHLNLGKTALALLKTIDKQVFTSPTQLAQKIKNFSVEVSGYRPIDEVISTAGGVSFEELDEYFVLKQLNNVYCIGEMVDWEAPTGGYLLQACFSMGYWTANAIINP